MRDMESSLPVQHITKALQDCLFFFVQIGSYLDFAGGETVDW